MRLKQAAGPPCRTNLSQEKQITYQSCFLSRTETLSRYSINAAGRNEKMPDAFGIRTALNAFQGKRSMV